jgi:putative aldouronate transport system permease protein
MIRLTRKTQLSDIIFISMVYIILYFSLIVVLIPIIFIISSSFSSATAVANGDVFLLPVNFNLKGYKNVFNSPQIMMGYLNSLIYAILGALSTIILTMLAAYPLSRNDFKARNMIMLIFTITMLFNGGIIPLFMVVKKLGMIDTIWSMFIPGALNVFSVIMARTFIQSYIPNELFEAASLDGCSDGRYLWKVVVPLSKPIIAVIVLWAAVAQWNSYFNALIFINNINLQPLQIVLRNILIVGDYTNITLMADPEKMVEARNMKYLYQYSLIVVACLPVMLLYPFAQKYFIKGIMIGSIKG